jgi:hypothetical protein
VFDLLKNKGLDRTTHVVLCLIVKLFQGLDKSRDKRQDKNINFCHSLKHKTTFCSKYNLSKISIYNFIHQTYVRQKIVQYHKSLFCVILPYVRCAVLSCIVQSSTYSLTDQTHP